MQTRWLGIIGAVLVVAALGLGLAGSALLSDTSTTTMPMMGTTTGTMDHSAMDTSMQAHHAMMQQSMSGTGMMGSGAGMMGGWGWATLVRPLFWLGALLLIFWGALKLFPGYAARLPLDAQAILAQRFARGEIKREEYEEMRATLGQERPA